MLYLGGEDERLFVRQAWVKKKTRHTRMLAKRFIQIRQSTLYSFKKAAWESGAEPTCIWNLIGVSILFKQLSAPKPQWQIQIVDGPYIDPSEEICFVFDSQIQATRWSQYIERIAMFGSLNVSYFLHPSRDVIRELRGLNLPFFLRLLPLLIPESSFVKMARVKAESIGVKSGELGYTKLPFLIWRAQIPKGLFTFYYGVIFIINTQHSESVFLVRLLHYQNDVNCDCVGGRWYLDSDPLQESPRNIEDVRLVFEVPLLHRIEQIDTVHIRVYVCNHPSNEGGFKGMIALATGQKAGQAWALTSDISIPLALHTLYFNRAHSFHLQLSSKHSIKGSLRCTMPWWHVFNSVPPEATPLLQEYNYNEWIAEGRKVVALFNKITRSLSSAHWVAACEQPLTTICLLSYMTYFVILHPQNLILFCLVLPLLLAFSLTCPYAQKWTYEAVKKAPLLATVAHRDWTARLIEKEGSQRSLIAASPLLRALLAFSVPISDDWNKHHGLLLAAGTYRIHRFPFVVRCLGCVKILGLWTIYGGWQGFQGGTAQAHEYPMVERLNESSQPTKLTNFRISPSCSFISWFLRQIWPLRVQENTIWAEACVQVLREELDVCPSPSSKKSVDLVLRRLVSQVGASTVGSPSATLGDMLDDEFSSETSGDPIIEDEEGLVVANLTSHRRDPPISLMSKYTPRVFESKPWKIKDFSILTDLVPALSNQSPPTSQLVIEEMLLRQTRKLSQPQQTKRSTRKGGIRGAVKDVTSVSRVIISYRRSMERLINLFEWTHPLAALTLMLLVGAAVVVSPFVSWPSIALLSLITTLRRVYQKSTWHRYAACVMQLNNFLNHPDVKEQTDKLSYEFCLKALMNIEEFAKGGIKLCPTRGWLMNVIDHSINSDVIP